MITPSLRLVANSILAISILSFLMLVDPLVTVFCGGVLGLVYALIYLRVRGQMVRVGNDMKEALEARYLVAKEATGGIKDVKVMGLEDVYVQSYAAEAFRSAKAFFACASVGNSACWKMTSRLRFLWAACSSSLVTEASCFNWLRSSTA